MSERVATVPTMNTTDYDTTDNRGWCENEKVGLKARLRRFENDLKQKSQMFTSPKAP